MFGSLNFFQHVPAAVQKHSALGGQRDAAGTPVQETHPQAFFETSHPRELRPVLALTLLYVLAHNLLYTYIVPWLASLRSGVRVDTALLVFGLGDPASTKSARLAT